ncbi:MULTISPECIES: iron ABC transporter permease [Mesotoga]|uniref:ABC-type Fe3+ transport system, permease component n=2 Tax=Mesotoga prima TaxID=1184387 RepID=I2F6E5_9BACT|nr:MULTISPECIES: iron ABC transporter permease [Mesotoga]MCP5457650.1 iron ABC transporter permease [Thermotogota bacterium]CCU84633.1 Binding-protein-dependent transport systems inner membrane component [Mesotoga infera]AFK07498.1 ABC-type Fe3+ transport system, permease component [Mesotoga prima MesG1.Ag.4.2]MCB1223229.1 iron ABC transporter permease [Mesotoga sp.]MCP5461321.1 iron ABC transporter permease [Thermotogota bacterium]
MAIRGEEAKNRFLNLLKDPVLLLIIVLIFAALAIFIVYPLFRVFAVSMTDKEGGFDLSAYSHAFSNRYMRQGFFNSLLVAGLTAIFGMLVGYLFAYTLNRTDIPLKGFFRTVAVLPIVFPPFIGALSIIMLFGFNGIITAGIFGIRNFPVYGLWGLMMAQVVCFFPVAFITLDGVIGTISPTLEDAAFNLGANRWQAFRKVILPMSVPGIASTMLVLFIESLADFGNPLILAGSKFPVLSVQAYLQITGMFDTKGGAALAVWLLFPSIAAFIIQKYWVGKKKYVTVTGKPTTSVLKSVSKPVKWILFSLCMLIAVFTLTIYATIFWGAFVKAWGMNNTLTLENFKYVFDVGLEAIKDTLVIAFTSTPISAVLGMIIAFLLVRKVFPGRRVMEFTSMLSFAVPGTVIGIGYILSFNKPPLLLTGTLAILVLNFVFRYIPVGIQSGVALLNQVDPAIEEAAYTLGADNRQVFTKVTLPLIMPAFFSALVFAFVRAMTAISAAIFLVSARWNLITVQILSQSDSGRLSEACAFSVLLIGMIMGFILILKIFLKNKISLSSGGTAGQG